MRQSAVAVVTAGLTDSVKDRVRALDSLLDQHLLTVDDYIEQRNRITRGPVA